MAQDDGKSGERGGFDVSSVTALIKQGKAVVSGESSVVVDAVMNAIESGRSATFYVSVAQYGEIMRRHWSPELLEASGMKPLSDAEIERIKSGLSLDVDGYSNIIDCPRCGHGYGMYEFLEQGIQEHGRTAVESITAARDFGVIRVNPFQVPVCPQCKLRIQFTAATGGGHDYICRAYGCCMENPIHPPKRRKLAPS